MSGDAHPSPPPDFQNHAKRVRYQSTLKGSTAIPACGILIKQSQQYVTQWLHQSVEGPFLSTPLESWCSPHLLACMHISLNRYSHWYGLNAHANTHTYTHSTHTHTHTPKTLKSIHARQTRHVTLCRRNPWLLHPTAKTRDQQKLRERCRTTSGRGCSRESSSAGYAPMNPRYRRLVSGASLR